jgi:hypothetical protein
LPPPPPPHTLTPITGTPLLRFPRPPHPICRRGSRSLNQGGRHRSCTRNGVRCCKGAMRGWSIALGADCEHGHSCEVAQGMGCVGGLECVVHAGWVTPSAGSVPKILARIPDSVKIRSKCTAIRENFPRMHQNDEIQGHVADHWRGGCVGLAARVGNVAATVGG